MSSYIIIKLVVAWIPRVESNIRIIHRITYKLFEVVTHTQKLLLTLLILIAETTLNSQQSNKYSVKKI